MSSSASGRFTGRHMAVIMVAFFAVVIAVNMYMARMAGATFGGVVVDNSYVASQNFNRWLDEAAVESALGWSAEVLRGDDGRITVVLKLKGEPGEGAALSGHARHPLGREPDRAIAFEPLGNGHYRSVEVLPAGRWRLRLTVRAGDTLWRTEGDVR